MTKNKSDASVQRLLFIVTSLNVGGAETALLTLVTGLLRAGQRYTVTVVALTQGNRLVPTFRDRGIEVIELGLPSLKGPLGLWWRLPIRLYRFARFVKSFKPTIIQGWMYHGNIVAHIARIFFPSAKVMVSIRQSLPSLEKEKWTTRQVLRMDAWMARWADKVIYNAHAGQRDHERLGYPPQKTAMLYNGYDTSRFRPDPNAHAALCEQLGVPSTSFIIGLVGRFHPMKDHGNFLAAAALISREYEAVYFVMMGKGITADNPALKALLDEHPNIVGRWYCLGERQDVAVLTAGFDIATSASSHNEGMPNVVCEAMACGVPCVVSDVGDAKRLVGATGFCVPPKDPAALANAWKKLIDMPAQQRYELGQQARERVINNYSEAAMVAAYEKLLQ